MTYEIVWDEPAINAAAHFLKDDPEGLRQLMDAIDLFSVHPRPEWIAEYDPVDLRRMHVGRYCVLYEITGTTVTIVGLHTGRTG